MSLAFVCSGELSMDGWKFLIVYLFECRFRGIDDTIFLTTNPNGSCSEWLCYSPIVWIMLQMDRCFLLIVCHSGIFLNSTFSLFLSGDRGKLELKKSLDYGRTFKTIGSRIYSFGLGGRFVFASIMTDSVSSLKILMYRSITKPCVLPT